jgi:hypothetical protein
MTLSSNVNDLAGRIATEFNTVRSEPSSSTAVVKHQVKLGQAVTKGQAVYISSANGTNMIASKASNASESTSSKTMGLAEASGALNDQVNVITEGLLAGLNTDTATAGDPVWLGTSGNLIYGASNAPVAPAHLVFIGIVTRVSATNGEIFIRPQNGFELQELHNVLLDANASIGDNEVLAWDSGSSLWKNQTASEAGLATPSDVSSAVSTHNSATTSVHGIADTSALATKTYADNAAATAAAALVASAPSALDTLNELAASLGNDANFATTLTNALAAKAPLAGPTFTGTVVLPSTVNGPNISTSVNLLFSTQSGHITLGGGQTTGAITIGGGDSRNGAINIGTGATTTGTKYINIGTGTSTGGTSAIVIGSSGGTSTTTFQGTSVTVNSPLYAGTIISTSTSNGNLMTNVGSAGTIDAFASAGLIHVGRSVTTGTLNLLTNAASSGTKTINIGTAATGGTTAITIGSSSGATSTIALNGTITLPSTTSIGNVSATELGYLDGVTSSIQTQLDDKRSSSTPLYTTDISDLLTLATIANIGDALVWDGVNGWSVAPMSGGASSTAVSSNITLAAGKYFVDTSSARTLTLPANPSLGDEIIVFDANGNAGTNNITIDNNTAEINGVSSTAILDVNWVEAKFTCVSASGTISWKMK